MAAFGIAQLRSVRVGPQIALYLEHVDATLAPFHGCFLVHGAVPEVLEGDWPGSLVVIEFPDMERARAWYNSAGYQKIVRLRTNNAISRVIIVEGVGPNYQAVELLSR